MQALQKDSCEVDFHHDPYYQNLLPELLNGPSNLSLEQIITKLEYQLGKVVAEQKELFQEPKILKGINPICNY